MNLALSRLARKFSYLWYAGKPLNLTAFQAIPKAVKVFLLFLLLFLVLFVQYPLAGSLPGYVDTWLYLGLFNDYWNHVVSWFTGADVGHCLYPAGPPYAYLEPSYAAAPFYWLFQWLGFNDLWAYWGFISLFFSLNATGAYLLGRQYLENDLAAVFTALAFTLSSYALGNLEHQNALFYFPALMAVYHFRAFLSNGMQLHLLATMLLGGTQIYFGTYTFIFQSMVLAIIGLVQYRAFFFTGRWLQVAKWLPLYALLAAPYVYAYLMNPELEHYYNPSRADAGAIRAMSLHFNDLYRVLVNNLLYKIQTDLPQIFVYNLRAASLGVMLWLLAVVGTIGMRKHRGELLLLLAVSLIIAVGAKLDIGNTSISMPMGWLYGDSDAGAFLRHPVRMFFIASMVLSILAGAGLLWLSKQTKLPLVVLLLVAAVFFVLENVPFPLEKYESAPYIRSERLYSEISIDEQPKVLLELPSSLDFESFDLGKPINQFTREYIYMYWQTKHKQHVLNGGVAFFPPERIRNAKLISGLPNDDALRTLIQLNQLDYIIYHPEMELKHDNPILDYLQGSVLLKELSTTKGYHIFEVAKP